MRRFLLWDHDGVLVDTERWYFAATRECLNHLEIDLDQNTYLRFMADGRPSWDLARARGISEETIDQLKRVRDASYREYLCRQPIEIDGVIEVLDGLRDRYRMGIVTTSKRSDFDLIHRSRKIVPYFEFVISIEDCARAIPDVVT
jgi:beta-phosphoglucomutase-like phosphatase (HAD superfamily)